MTGFIRKSKGISFIELTISMFIMSIIIMGMFLTLSSLMKAGQKNIDHSSGFMAASSVLKEYILRYKGNFSEGQFKGKKAFGFKNYKYVITVVRNKDVNAYQLTSEVEWSDQVDHYGRGGGGNKIFKAKVSTIVENKL